MAERQAAVAMKEAGAARAAVADKVAVEAALAAGGEEREGRAATVGTVAREAAAD